MLSDGEPSLQNIVIDENEWTDRNFGTEDDDAADATESDLSDSDDDSDASGTETDDDDDDSEDDEYEEAEGGSPLDAHTLKLANDWIGQQRYSSNDDEEFCDSSDGECEGGLIWFARAQDHL